MSDLIEKLIQKLSEVEAARGPAKHILNERLADLGQVAWDHWEEIVEALETVRGIEEIASQSRISISRGEMLSREGKPLWCVGQGMIGHYGPTLSAAVEAARKGM